MLKEAEKVKEKRTDLALEVRESFPGDGGEIPGVSLEKEEVYIDTNEKKCLLISTVKILNKQGEEMMRKPKGSYITIETGDITCMSEEEMENTAHEVGKCIKELAGDLKSKKVMVAGLGNRDITADSLGPLVVDHLNITRHYAKEFGKEFLNKLDMGEVCALAPGVMAQTGMEAEEVLGSVAKNVEPDVIVVIDALAARSVHRVTSTIQITDTGIKPGSGVGNHRVGLNEESLGVKVIAVGVPTVVEAEVIVEDRIEDFMIKQGFEEGEIQTFIDNMGEPAIRDMYVTTKNIDETVMDMGELIADSINCLTH